MKTSAAVLVETGRPLEIIELEIPALRAGQVLVQLAFSGVCHTQILEARGFKGKDAFVPHCMGHEGSGTVIDIGPEVSKVEKGQKVLLSWIKGSGCDVPGTQYKMGNGRTVNAGGVTTFSYHSVVSENRLTVLPPGMQLSQGTMIGCAVATGMGAVFNTAAIKSGQSIAIFGCGGIGLFAIAAAKIAGAKNIIAVDINPAKLEVALSMGATHVLDSSPQTPDKLRKIVGPGADIAIEASGRPDVMRTALESVRNQGGIAVVVGNARHDESLVLDPKQFNMGKQLRGTWGGDSVPDRDFPTYCDYLNQGMFSIEPLQAKTYRLEEINDALLELETGKTVRPLIAF